jgi:hypothetical protein
MTRNDRSRIAPRRVRRQGLEPLEERALLALIFWKAAVSGDWSNPANWSTGTVPTINDVASIPFKGINVTSRSGPTPSPRWARPPRSTSSAAR